MKKAFIILGIFIILVIAGVGLYSLIINSSTSQKPPQGIGVSVSLPPKYEEGERDDENAIYTSDSFQISHPASWGAYVYNFPLGQEITFKPKELRREDVIPSFQVTVTTESSSDALSSQFNRYKEGENPYKQETKNIGGSKANCLTGEFPFYTEGKKLIQKEMQETICNFKKGEALFTLRYRYSGEQKNSVQEDFFNSYIRTFKLL